MNIIKSDGMYYFRNVHFTNEEIDVLSELVDEAVRCSNLQSRFMFDLTILKHLQKGFSSLKDNKSHHAFVESF